MKKTILTLLILSIVTVTFAQKNKLTIGENAHWEATIKTSAGPIIIKLYNETPKHRDNFVKLSQEGFYNNLLFHRVIKEFMIQCGDPKSREASEIAQYGDTDAGYNLPAEIAPQYFHKKGTIAAARTPDEENPERESSGSQFYIVIGKVQTDSTLMKMDEKIKASNGAEITPDRREIYKTIGGTPHLDGSYTIFGEVISGMKNAEKISLTPTFENTNRPRINAFIKSVELKIVEDK